MEDDIDIEEHDVLDNPVIKNMFPDITVIKKEIQQYYEDVPETDQADGIQVKCEAEREDQPMNVLNISQFKTEKFETKIEGNSSNVDIDSDSTISNSQIHTNKIILGSKPSTLHVVEEYENFFEKQLTNIQPKVLIDDMQPYLERSGRYCTPCAILFPNIKALGFHNESVHALVEAEDNKTTLKKKQRKRAILTLAGLKIKCNICKIIFRSRVTLQQHLKNVHSNKPKDKKIQISLANKKCCFCNKIFSQRGSLIRHCRNFHMNKIVTVKEKRVGDTETDKINSMIKQVRNKMKTNEPSPSSESNSCFHCSKKFTSPQSLIEHLYQVMLSKKPHKTEKTAESVQIRPNKHDDLKNIKTLKKTVPQRKTLLKSCLYYRCRVCSYYFNNTMSYVAHLAKNHKITTQIKLNRLPFDIKCKFCQENIKDVDTYNLHLKSMHALHYLSTPRTENEMLKSTEKVTHKSKTLKREHCPKLASKESSKKVAVDDVTIQKSKTGGSKYSDKVTYNENKLRTGSTDVDDQEKVTHKSKTLKREHCSKVASKESSKKVSVDDVTIQKSKTGGSKYSDKVTYNENKLRTGSTDVDDQVSREIAGNINTLLLKSTIFKCNKCDIYFLTAGAAMNHSVHMELLINWKCAQCNRIFKKNDEFLHERQHLHSEKFVVMDLPENALSRVLYGCPKCTVHFNERNFLKHYTTCGTEAPNSTYCKYCDILIDANIGKSHKFSHEYENLKAKDFPVIVTDIIQCNLNMQSEKPRNLKRKSNDKETGVEFLKKIYTHRFNRSFMFDLSYCTTCKCYVTDHYKRSTHLGGHCGHLGKHVCKSCGLVMTVGSYRGHKNLHEQISNLKLQDFRFFELQSGKPISPPVPELPKCDNCDVRFVSKTDSRNHSCSDEDYLTCHICDIKLSDVAFKLHMLFHNFKNESNEQAIETTSKIISSNHKPLVKNVSKNPKNTEIGPKVVVSKMVADKKLNKTENSIKLVNEKRPLKISDKPRPKQIPDQKKSTVPETNIKSTSENKVGHSLYQSADSTTDLLKDSIDMTTMGLLFTCKNCGVSVDSYDRAVEHCQLHYIQKEWNLEFGLCSICNLKLDKQCLASHQKLHNVFKYGNTNFFKELKFDAFYLTAETDVWMKHVFGTLQQGEIDKILSTSIYKYEHKIKMDVIQDGPPDLTVYKCEKCRCFIDQSSLNRHAENSCFKLRRHPCTFCGLAFMSSLARIEHEKNHKRPNISARSYRIVTFNREKDKTLNSTLNRTQYILYQCRNCNVAVDKSATKCHKCSPNHNDRQKCLNCGLLLHVDEYALHQLRHKELIYFTKYMKIILFGDKVDNIPHVDTITPTFEGDIHDYTLYECAKCHICVKNDISRHICSHGSSRAKCVCCDLYFMTGKFKNHRKLHEIDPDFTRDNMRIIIFNSSSPEPSSSSMTNQIEKVTNDTISNDNPNHSEADKGVEENIKKLVSKDVEQKTVNVYKCTCGVCFLDETSAIDHSKKCNPKLRSPIQKCSKCELVFSPNILFRHLLEHHGDKKLIYSYNVIEIDKQCDPSLIYQCSKCLLHFTNNKDKSHFKSCDGSETDSRVCSNCNLSFHTSSVTDHETVHDTNSVYEFRIKIIDEQSTEEV